MKTVVFDLDGTLADTSGDLLAAANASLHAAGRGRPLGQGDALTAFEGGRALLRLGLSRDPAPWDEGDVARAYPDFLREYAGAIDMFTRLYPGVGAALALLQAKGFALSICTNKPVALAEDLTRRLGIRHHFGALVGAGTMPVQKPDPAPLREAVRRVGGDAARAFLVGDSATDVACARAAGMPVVLVGFGPEGPAARRHAPDHMLRAYSGLPALAQRLLP